MTLPYQTKPLGDWQGEQTPSYDRMSGYTFRSTEAQTQALLARELTHLGASSYTLRLDLSAGDIRADGKPRSNARFGGHPGVVVEFDCDVGHLRYATDVFATWQSNLRAIALALEALRKIDRYGVARRGEQYAGFAAIEAAAPMFHDVFAAADWMRQHAVKIGVNEAWDAKTNGPGWTGLYRAMANTMHPDRGGDPDEWNKLAIAKEMIDAEGWA